MPGEITGVGSSAAVLANRAGSWEAGSVESLLVGVLGPGDETIGQYRTTRQDEPRFSRAARAKRAEGLALSARLSLLNVPRRLDGDIQAGGPCALRLVTTGRSGS
jgi:hypothetical protein